MESSRQSLQWISFLIVLCCLPSLVVRGFPVGSRIGYLPQHPPQIQSPTRLFDSSSNSGAELEHDEPMSVIFQRALVLQRAGSHEEALKEYQLFLKAAEQCAVDPSQYAEVHVNCGALYLRQGDKAMAEHHLEAALEHRKMGNAYVNLAVLQLQQAQCPTIPRSAGLACLRQAKKYCQQAVDLNDDPAAVQMAQKLLGDIDMMLLQAGG